MYSIKTTIPAARNLDLDNIPGANNNREKKEGIPPPHSHSVHGHMQPAA
jgi:hypothetical protein